jgi:general secretion pathway protein N
MGKLRVGLLAALVLTVLLIVMAPARVLQSVLPGEQVLLQGLSGTLWRGHAARALVAAGSGYLHLGALDWRLSPFSLLLFAPELDLHSSWGGQSLSSVVRYGGSDELDLYDLDAVLPAALVQEFIPLELGGSFSLQAEHLSLRQGLPRRGSGRLVWQNGAWVSPQGRRSLGTYAVDFEQAPGEPLIGRVITLGGDLQAEGQISIEDRNLEVDVLLSGPGLADPQLQQALQLVAVPEGDSFRVTLQSAL